MFPIILSRLLFACLKCSLIISSDFSPNAFVILNSASSNSFACLRFKIMFFGSSSLLVFFFISLWILCKISLRPSPVFALTNIALPSNFFLSFLLLSQWLPEFYWFESFQAQDLWIQMFSYKAKTFLVFFALAYFILRSQVAIARHLSKKAKDDPFPYLLSKPLELIADLFKAYQHMLDEYHIIKWSKRIIYVFTEMILIIISLKVFF